MERSSIETIDTAAKFSLYVVSALEPVLAMLLIGSEVSVPAWVLLLVFALAVLHTALCLKVLSMALRFALGGTAPSRAIMASAAAFTVVSAVGVGVAASASSTTAIALAMLFLAAFTCSVAPMVRAAPLILAVLVSAALASLVQTGFGSDSDPGLPTEVWYVLWAGSAALSFRWSAWMLTLVWDIDRSRQLEARLAVAEERLRFARDLHDTIGRNLTLISITTELVARSAQRTNAEALPHLDEIRRVARESIKDMREVVGGYRATDLAVEMAGARSLLQSAGVRARVIGDPKALPRELQTALGWVVREGVTNIIRHSRASSARIELDIEPIPGTKGGKVTLRIENDGVDSSGPSTPKFGNGLTGLNERLEELAGDVSIGIENGWFHMQACLPLAQSTGAPLNPRAAIS